MQDNGILLYRRFQNGDERALEDLIALYQRGLLRFICGYVHDIAVAEDILTDVFLTLYYKRSFKEKHGATFKTYLYKIARNKSLNYIKQQARRKELSLESLTEKGEGVFEEELDLYSPTPEGVLESNEQATIVRNALLSLKQEYREVLTLRYFEDLSPEMIATVTKKKTKQVYNLLARGKIAIKEALLAGGISYEDT